MARFYSNENFPLPVVVGLRSIGHDVLTSHEAGNANKKVPDDLVLAYAATHGRALLTLNRKDFIRLHRAGTSHEGIVACSADTDYVALANRIDAAVRPLASLKGIVVRVTRSG